MIDVRYKFLLLGGMILCCWQWADAQDKIPSEQLYEAFAARYMDSVSNRTTIFYGKLQEPLWMITSNNPYFKDARYTKSKIRYGGSLYTDIPLRWDLYRDELVVLSPDNYNVVLSPDKTEDATFHGYHIRYLKKDSLSNSPPPGYYLLLHAGPCTVLVKHTAVMQQKSYNQRIENYFMFATKYYIKKENVYFPVKNKNTLLNALGDYHQELSRLIRANRFTFKRDAEAMIVTTVKEYEKMKYHP